MRRPRYRIHWNSIFFGLGGLVLLFLAALLIVGLLFIYSASYSIHNNYQRPYAQRQFMWVFISLIPALVVLLVDYRWLVRNSFWIYLGAVFLLVLTGIIGTVRGGAKRWIKVGPLLLQTSEIMKISIILVLAKILTATPSKDLKDLIPAFVVTLGAMGLIVIQPDLGTSLVFIPIVFVMIWASGIPYRLLGLLMIAAVWVGLGTYTFGLHQYQRDRITAFFSQGQMTQEQKRGTGYHLTQSKISHGNGGWLGKGWRQGSQNTYKFLPEGHTDFIFAVIGEEWGFAGTFLVLFLYLGLFFSMILVAYTIPIPEGQLIVLGVMTLLFTQVVVNTCMTVGMAPITGLPLPFLSYGGSSLMFNMVSIALVLSVSARKDG